MTLRDSLRGGVGPRAYLSSDQSLPSSTNTKVGYDTVREGTDPFDEFDAGTGTFTAAFSATYAVTARFSINVAADQQQMDLRLQVNGSRERRNTAFTNTTNGGQGVFISTHLDLDEGDTVEIVARSNSSDTIRGRSDETFFEVVRC